MAARPDNQPRQTANETLTQVLGAGDDQDPGYLALLMAASFYTNLDIDAYMARLDDLAERAKIRLGRGRTPDRVISAINTVLFVEEGFAGNVENYYDPRNSFLNDVLQRRTGIPISLSVLYLAIAFRMGQPIAGVGLPLHFIVKYTMPRCEMFVDPFFGGRILTRDECRQRVESAYGATFEFQESFLAAIPPRQVLYRMLNNLKFIYLKRQEFERAGQAVDIMLTIEPDQPEEIRDRGLLHFQLENWAGAARCLHEYLQKSPDAPDAESIRGRLQDAADRRAILN